MTGPLTEAQKLAFANAYSKEKEQKSKPKIAIFLKALGTKKACTQQFNEHWSAVTASCAPNRLAATLENARAWSLNTSTENPLTSVLLALVQEGSDSDEGYY